MLYLPVHKEGKQGGIHSAKKKQEGRESLCVLMRAWQGTCWPTIVTSVQSRPISVTPHSDVSQGGLCWSSTRERSRAPETKAVTDKQTVIWCRSRPKLLSRALILWDSESHSLIFICRLCVQFSQHACRRLFPCKSSSLLVYSTVISLMLCWWRWAGDEQCRGKKKM